MKKHLSLMLVVLCVAGLVLTPGTASAKYVTDKMVLEQDMSLLTAGKPVWNRDGYGYGIGRLFQWMNNGQATSAFGVPEIVADAGLGKNILTLSSSNASFNRLELRRNQLKPEVTENTVMNRLNMTFKVSGTSEEYVRIWRTLDVVSVARLKVKLPSNAAVQALSNTDANGKQNQVLCLCDSDLSAYVVPVCLLENDVWYRVEYDGYASGNLKYLENIAVYRVDTDTKLTNTLLDSSYLNSKLRWADSGYAGLSGVVYNEATDSAYANIMYIPQQTASTDDSYVTLSVAHVRQDTLVDQPLAITSFKLDDTEAGETGNVLSPTGKVDVTFTDAPTGATATLTEGTMARVAPAGTVLGNVYSLDFSAAPLHPNTAYTLTVAEGTASRTVSFTTSYDGYYINENFATYPTIATLNNNASFAPWSWNSGHGEQPNRIISDGGRKAVQMGILSTMGAASNQKNGLVRAGSTMPQVTYSDIREAEVSFRFTELGSYTRLLLWTQLFYVQKNNDGNYTLYVASQNSGAQPICQLQAQTEYTVRFVYSASNTDKRVRYLHRIYVNGTEYTGSQTGLSFAEQALWLSEHGSGPIELNSASGNVTLVQIIVTDAAPTNPSPTGTYPADKEPTASLYLYSIKYRGHENTSGKTYEVSANAQAAQSGVDVTVSARDYAGQARAETVVAAAYDTVTKKLLDVATVSVNISKLGIFERTVNLETGSASNYQIKLFRLNDLEVLQPLAAAAPVAVTQ